MPYEKKSRELDAPVGTIRLAQREMQDRRAVVQVPGATGGAPTRGAGGALAGAVGEDILPGLGQMKPPLPLPTQPFNEDQRFLELTEPRYTSMPSLLPNLRAVAQENFERFARADPDLVERTKMWLDQTRTEGVVSGMDNREFAERAFAYLRTFMEPGPEAPRLVDTIQSNVKARVVYNWLRRMHGRAPATFRTPPIERGE